MDDLMSSCSSPPSAPPPPPSITPPSSPNVQARDSPWEPLELQLDYWQLPKYNDQQQTTTTTSTTTSIIKTDKTTKQQDSKISMKALFRGLQAMPTTTSGLNITIHLANKEKKQKSKQKMSIQTKRTIVLLYFVFSALTIKIIFRFLFFCVQL